MSGAHTPGPWLVTPGGCYLDEVGMPISPPTEFHIAAIHAVLRVGSVSIERREADARLAGAAPDLLLCLRDAADSFADLAKALRLLGRPIAAEACDIAEKGCRDEIAKATGAA